MRAYDIELLHRSADRNAPDCHGWCFGLPPGITPEQWPLDRNTGFPLKHGFTLLLPEDHRVHGPEIVALSFFAHAGEYDYDAPDDGFTDAVMGKGSRPSDPSLAIFWDVGRQAHPRTHRMQCVLGHDYAVILLTRDEFEAPLCPVPALRDSSRYPDADPSWLTLGSAAAYWKRDYRPCPSRPLEQHWLYRTLGEIPAETHAFDRALRWTPRDHDPNAGIGPREARDGHETGYTDPRDPMTFETLPWAETFAADHIGGTMRPTQDVPAFSPHYIEFEEYLGGYNFGGGNAQLDFKDLRFDWACG